MRKSNHFLWYLLFINISMNHTNYSIDHDESSHAHHSQHWQHVQNLPNYFIWALAWAFHIFNLCAGCSLSLALIIYFVFFWQFFLKLVDILHRFGRCVAPLSQFNQILTNAYPWLSLSLNNDCCCPLVAFLSVAGHIQAFKVDESRDEVDEKEANDGSIWANKIFYCNPAEKNTNG